MNPLTILAKRFIAGETVEDAIRVVSSLNSMGMKATIDILGENVESDREALNAADAYIHLIERIAASGVDSNVSLKLTQMGLDVGEEFCINNVTRIIEEAKSRDNFVRIDMEGSSYTESTLSLFKKLRKKFDNVGIVIQSYLYRSEKDIKKLIPLGCRIRLCKGAYKEPRSVSFRTKEEVNANYIRLMKILLSEGTYPAIATHDPAMIEATKQFAVENDIASDRFEFQMLYGIARKLQREIIEEGYTMRIYVPYGSHWLPYFARRLRERKENVFFLMKHLFVD